MLSMKTSFITTLLVAFLGASSLAQAAKVDPKGARAECFRKAQEAANTAGFGANTGDRNAVGTDAYRQCCYKAGIRP